MTVKVGQIYEELGDYGFKYVITKVRPYNDKYIKKYYHVICDDGDVFDKLFEQNIKEDQLVAEYPTWQEAVNSPEFKGEK